MVNGESGLLGVPLPTDEMYSDDLPDEEHRYQGRRVIKGMSIVLGALAAAGLLVASGAVKIPFDPGFSKEVVPTAAVSKIPCPPPGTPPTPWDELIVNVYNGTQRTGLATQTGNTLTSLGIQVKTAANNPQGSITGTAQIVTSKAGAVQAYTIKGLLPQADVIFDARSDNTIDVVLGPDFVELLNVDNTKKVADALVLPPECQAQKDTDATTK